MMRVEEMVLIEAETAGMQNESKGIQILTDFAKTRDPQYVYGTYNEAYNNFSTPALRNEIWWQRRVEFWGEGLATFDIKRLQKGIIRSYPGTNHQQIECALEICTTNSSLYRLRDVFGTGYSMKMQLLDVQGEDEDGVYTLFRVPASDTPWQVKLSSGAICDVFVEDIGYWQGNASFVTSVSGYENGFYEDGSAFFRLAWMADGVGCVSYTSPSFFIPYED